MPPQVDNSSSIAKDPKVELTYDRVQVDNKVYSAVELSKFHPGGEIFLKAFGGADATEAFLSYHRRKFPHEKLTSYLIGESTALKGAHDDDDYLELCRLVEQVLPRHKSFAPFHYYVKMFVILGACIGLELYIHLNAKYVWYLTAPLGLLMAFVGLNIQHDANHGSISKSAIVNQILGYSQNWIGGSSIDWIHQHDVQHHIFTNDVRKDPDIAGNFMLRLNPLKPLLKYHMFQYLYVFVLIGFFGFSVVFESFLNIVKGRHFTPFARLLLPYRPFEMMTCAFYFFRWFILPVWQRPSLETCFQIAPMFIAGGYYLALFFIISHNFVGVHVFDAQSPHHNNSFLYNQVVSSANVGGPFLAFINGGLNYQIEHHLFPRMQHSHYATVAPIVREFCKKKNIPYIHFPSVADNVRSCAQHLLLMGTKQEPEGMLEH